MDPHVIVLFGATGAAPPEDVRIMGEAKARGELFTYVTNGVQYQNLAAVDNYGLQAAYSGSALERTLHFGVNAIVARAYRSGMATDVFLSTAPVVSGNARIAYDLHPSLATVGLASQLLGERYAESAYASLFPKPPKAPAQLELRLAVSGQVPGVSRLRYQIAGGRSCNLDTGADSYSAQVRRSPFRHSAAACYKEPTMYVPRAE